MSSLKKIEKDRAFAELASVDEILRGLGDADYFTRMSLEDRRAEIREYAENLQAQPAEGSASIALFFGGTPVLANIGIESEFASDALGKFQDLVSKFLANSEGNLGQRGVVPNKAASKLHVTNIVRGSFGFLLEESNPQRALVSTDLKTAVTGVSDLLRSLSSEGEDEFEQQLEDVDTRVLEAAKGFFDTLLKSGATLRAVTDGREASFNHQRIQRGIERADSVRIDESESRISGTLQGILPYAHRFEIRTLTDDRAIISGAIERNLTQEQLVRVAQTLTGRKVVATIKVKTVFRNAALSKTVYRLSSIDADGAA